MIQINDLPDKFEDLTEEQRDILARMLYDAIKNPISIDLTSMPQTNYFPNLDCQGTTEKERKAD